MGRVGRYIALGAMLLALWPGACSQQHPQVPPNPATPVIRVRLLASQQQVTLTATASPTACTASDPAGVQLNFPKNTAVPLTLARDGWHVGAAALAGSGELKLVPAGEGALEVNGKRYRGNLRFVPTSPDSFDVVNDVDVDGYLKSVVSREMLHDWNEETYKAQAIVARTYAIYETRTAGAGRNWDILPDQRSQVYGGMDDETRRSSDSVEQTSGIVVAFGERGREKVFKSYFSACCGGATQSSLEAFNESFLPPLGGHDQHSLCSGSYWFNWGPVEIKKYELARRFRMWGTRRNRPEKDMAAVASIEIQSVNEFNRPTRFLITDARGGLYSLSGEELRVAVNNDATKETRLLSSFVKIVSDPASETIKFVEGHGNGHGVGMCQYCSQARAEAGMRHEDIVLSAFPKSRLVRAY